MTGRIEDNQRGNSATLRAHVLYCRDEAKALKSPLAAYLLEVAALALDEEAASDPPKLPTGASGSAG
jgi:hypothetical protein